MPYSQLWICKIATPADAIALMLLFLIPVTSVQALTDTGKVLKWLDSCFCPILEIEFRITNAPELTGFLPMYGVFKQLPLLLYAYESYMVQSDAYVRNEFQHCFPLRVSQ